MMTFEDAVALAAMAHKGQCDLAGEPYLIHLLTVALGAFESTKSVDAAVVGVLHDIVEDTSVTLDDLRLRGLTQDQIRAIDGMTKRPDENYRDRIIRGLHKGGPLYPPVKSADLRHNLDLRRIRGRRHGLTDRDAERLTDYLWALTQIEKF